jgi:type III restriction enzyme
MFEEEYQALLSEALEKLPFEDGGYRKHLESIDLGKTHNGYFSIDKKTKKLTDPSFKTRGEEAGLSDDTDAYDLILKDKERLLSFEEPVRFIFSHSALREGWDNPNVFVMCMLKQSDNTISRRQEVGRGLRLCVNQDGSRVDDPSIVHDINVLTVVASESYKDFVANLQREIRDALSDRPVKVDEEYFIGQLITVGKEKQKITQPQARKIHRYLVASGYVTDGDELSAKYHEDKGAGTLAALPEELATYQEEIFKLIDAVLTDDKLPQIEDGRSPKDNLPNANLERKEFKELWNRINRKAIYRVDFQSEELIEKSIDAINKELRVTPLQYVVELGEQVETVSEKDLKDGSGFKTTKISREKHNASVNSNVAYDLLGKLAESTQLKRSTLAKILAGIESAVFEEFRKNPEQFIAEASRLINEQKATAIIERLSYDTLNDKYDQDIFTIASKTDFAKAGGKLQKHVYDYVATDSKVERDFVAELDASAEVVVYVKLPKGFKIPTPVGNYNPDWAIAFNHESVKHVYFVAETKGSMSTMELSSIEQKKIECARRFFEKMNSVIDEDKVTYDVVTDYGKLMDIVGGRRS